MAWLTVERAQFEFLSGDPRAYQSSQGVFRRFCTMCGSQLTYENAANPGAVDITTASLDDPNAFPPAAEVWLEHRVPWQAVNRTLDQYPRGTGDGTAVES